MPRSRWRSRATAVLAIVCLAAAGVVAASPAFAEEELFGCSLRPNGRDEPLNEWATCVSASLALSTLPAVGETATLTIDVTAQFDRSAVRVEVDLAGAALHWVAPPAGFETAVVASNDPDDLGELVRASGTVTLAAAETRRLTGTVRAVERGRARIGVRAAAAVDEGMPSAADDVYLTVAAAGGVSTPGLEGN